MAPLNQEPERVRWLAERLTPTAGGLLPVCTTLLISKISYVRGDGVNASRGTSDDVIDNGVPTTSSHGASCYMHSYLAGNLLLHFLLDLIHRILHSDLSLDLSTPVALHPGHQLCIDNGDILTGFHWDQAAARNSVIRRA